MNIAIIHDWLTNMAGAEKVLLQILEIYPEADVYTSVYERAACPEFAKYKVNTTYLQRYSLFRRYREALIPYAPLAFEMLDLSSYDLVISSTTFAAKGVITKPDALHVCYCHTPTRYLWEPEIDNRAKSGFMSGLRQKTAHKLRLWDKVAAERPDYYLANSETVRERIKKYYKRESQVVYPPVEIDKFSYNKGISIQDYFLFVSRLIPYKKADLVIEAFNKLSLPLKIIGDGPEAARLRKIAGPNIDFLGRVDDEQLAKYYSQAKAFIFAAEEDFGIVPVEAMACGRPVITLSRGGAAETVLNGKTGLYFQEQSVESLVSAVRKFKAEEYDPEVIRARAKEFSAENFKKCFSNAVDNIIKDFNKKQNT